MRKLFIVLVSFLFVGCAVTKISSFKNPDIDFSSYKKILVCGNCRDIDFRKTLEADLVAAFTEKSILAVASIDIISPVKEYTPEELSNILARNNIDGFLSVEMLAAAEETTYVPQQTYTHYRSEYVNGKLITVPYTTTSGGYSLSYPKASFEIILTDISTGQIAFKATANSEGDEFSDMKTISKSLSKKIVEEYLNLSISSIFGEQTMEDNVFP